MEVWANFYITCNFEKPCSYNKLTLYELYHAEVLFTSIEFKGTTTLTERLSISIVFHGF